MAEEIDYEKLHKEKETLNSEIWDLIKLNCGCGEPEKVEAFVIEFLRIQDLIHTTEPSTGLLVDKNKAHSKWYDEIRAKQKKLITDDPNLVCEVILKFFDHVELMEHGGMVWNGWLSEKGKRLLVAKTRMEEIDKITAI